MKRLPFPRYLNRPRLLITFELDQIIFTIIVNAIILAFSIIFSIPFYVTAILIGVITYIANKIYVRLVKEEAPGFLEHFFYEKGILDVKQDKKNKEIAIPYGFEKHFID